MINNIRKILFALILLGLAGAYVGQKIYFTNYASEEKEGGGDREPLRASLMPSNKSLNEKADIVQHEKKPEEEIFLMGNAAEREKVHKWYIEQGYYDFDDQNQSYRSYDQATLETLAAKGDLRAIDALAKLYMTEEFVRENGLASSTQQFRNAAIWGSTFAFVRLATRYESEVYMFSKTPEEKRYAALEVLALYSAGELRGEKWMNRDSARTFKKLQGITLNETEQKFVAERANQIITDLQQERRRLGLGDFDNSVPPEVERFFNTLEEIDKKDASMQIK
ncbi:hypothetical protein [Cellvibrio sp.]|uniref:hypothetical protein n=1 Tax=Cellvibrio sp. TaxID=1965322 RepID=UPI0039647D32